MKSIVPSVLVVPAILVALASLTGPVPAGPPQRDADPSRTAPPSPASADNDRKGEIEILSFRSAPAKGTPAASAAEESMSLNFSKVDARSPAAGAEPARKPKEIVVVGSDSVPSKTPAPTKPAANGRLKVKPRDSDDAGILLPAVQKVRD